MERLKDTFLEKLDSISTFCIVDFRCSIGPNTFYAVQDITLLAQHKYSSSYDMEFKVFFNDFVANDFNNLFASLPSNKKYHLAATPGSFHGQLFLRASINVAYSSSVLH